MDTKSCGNGPNLKLWTHSEHLLFAPKPLNLPSDRTGDGTCHRRLPSQNSGPLLQVVLSHGSGDGWV